MKKTSKIIFGAIVLFFLIGIIFWAVDRDRIFRGKKPLFAINVGINSNTNSELYYGLGYVAVRCVNSNSSAEYTNIEILFSKKINHVCFSSQ